MQSIQGSPVVDDKILSQDRGHLPDIPQFLIHYSFMLWNSLVYTCLCGRLVAAVDSGLGG